ncbi:hypothetical protein DB88DRAFT_86885 [Papiliotrema laurentii]|uniref:Uncharacterized protein n=1 Tax=Papiliotrema laurentii TaxID=5418 RepID=A0AAD9FQ79_PAPLA|nr:hypothetical protein DB88DRAFT_86885 [Papiliotrema laurentii]
MTKPASSSVSPESRPRKTPGRQKSPSKENPVNSYDLGQANGEVSSLPNYRIGENGRSLSLVYLVSNIFALSFLAAVVLGLPNTMNGGTAVFKTSDEFVGVMRKCSATSCDPWLAGGSAKPRSGDFSYGGMFATLGIASLISLWFAIYITLVGIYRMIFRIPLDKGGTNKDSLSRYLYHTARVLLFVNSIIIFALIVDVFRRYFQYKLGKTDSAVGWGVGLLVLAFLFATLSALIDLGSPGGRTHRFIQSAGCGGECGGCGVCSCCNACMRACWAKKEDVDDSRGRSKTPRRKRR